MAQLTDPVPMLQQLAQAQKSRKRQLFVLSGKEEAAACDLQELISEHFTAQQVVWLGEYATPAARHVAFEGIGAELGSENDHVVFNAYSGFNVDAFAAIAGTIKAGGAMFLIIPTLRCWPTFSDPFLTRLRVLPDNCNDLKTRTSLYLKRMAEEINCHTRKIESRRDYSIRCFPLSGDASEKIRAEDGSQIFNSSTMLAPRKDYRKDSFCEGRADEDHAHKEQRGEQRAFIEAIKQLHQRQSHDVLILTADRGRGKSTALGIAAAELINQGPCKISTVAPTRKSIKIMMSHFDTTLTHPEDKVHLLTHAPDQIDQIDDDTELILVDEAASIPLPILVKISHSKKPTVFTTTVNGYEGAGRGFALRFTQRLKKYDIPFKWQTLKQPVRWSADDPLEVFCNQAFMLNAELPTAPSVVHLKKLDISEVTQEQLANDRKLLSSIYGLLVQAHYRTTPVDLVHILDGGNIRTLVAKLDGHLVSAALVAIEGPILEPTLRQGILNRKRRPNGHILPQLMAQYGMNASALDLSIARVVRIAVQPEIQGMGVGSEFLGELTKNHNKIIRRTAEPVIDGIGAIFGGVPETVKFWVKNDYPAWHISKRAQPANGYRSVSVFNALTPAATELMRHLKILHLDQISFQSNSHTNSWYERNLIEPGDSTVGQLAETGTGISAAQYDRFVIDHYHRGCRTFYDSQAAITRICIALLQSEKYMIQGQRNVDLKDLEIIQCMAQIPGISTKDLSKRTGLMGKKDAETRLRAILRRECCDR